MTHLQELEDKYVYNQALRICTFWHPRICRKRPGSVAWEMEKVGMLRKAKYDGLDAI